MINVLLCLETVIRYRFSTLCEGLLHKDTWSSIYVGPKGKLNAAHAFTNRMIGPVGSSLTIDTLLFSKTVGKSLAAQFYYTPGRWKKQTSRNGPFSDRIKRYGF